ncbi:hypothetical protein Sjap_024655 [Stephania japonica]|uniref:Uncharacterized protein n=1 Tax=Stephania japonica TaxID=461633 RepID=A0AAP0EL00_9MAGN
MKLEILKGDFALLCGSFQFMTLSLWPLVGSAFLSLFIFLGVSLYFSFNEEILKGKIESCVGGRCLEASEGKSEKRAKDSTTYINSLP